MNHQQYRFKFYFNASHAIYLSGEMGQSHPHTWEIILSVMKVTDNFVIFDEIEKSIEKFLSKYQNVFINTIQPFTTVNPTLENICAYFREKIQEMIQEKGWILLSIELSETPSRSYIISSSHEFEFSKSQDENKSDDVLQELFERLADEKINSLSNQNAALLKERAAALQAAQAQKTNVSNLPERIKHKEKKTGVLSIFAVNKKDKKKKKS